MNESADEARQPEPADREAEPGRDPAERLRQWLLVGPDGGGSGECGDVRRPRPIPSERRWWRREAIYLSDVCLAVHLSPAVRRIAPDEEEAAKEALYAYLRRVFQTALEHDCLRPLACVIGVGVNGPPEAGLVEMLRGWPSDQEWHRGAYTLYVEAGADAGARSGPAGAQARTGPSPGEADKQCGPPSRGAPSIGSSTC